MNKHRPTEERVSWTTTSLNLIMDVYHDVDDLRISHTDREEGFVKGTIADAAKITNHLVQACQL